MNAPHLAHSNVNTTRVCVRTEGELNVQVFNDPQAKNIAVLVSLYGDGEVSYCVGG